MKKDKELRRLSRAELLEMLIVQVKENESLRQQLAKANEELESRAVTFQEAGSLAEAALRLNDVFAAADAAAQQYLENIKEKSGFCQEMEERTKRRCADMVARTQRLCEQKLAERGLMEDGAG